MTFKSTNIKAGTSGRALSFDSEDTGHFLAQEQPKVNQESFPSYGRYELISRLAKGGMGEVFLGRTVGAAGFEKFVVIKRILPHLLEQKQFIESLIDEAKIVEGLTHPNIVQVYDFRHEAGDYFMVMEFVEGYNLALLAHYCAQTKIFIPAPVCIAIMIKVLDGLGYAHRKRDRQGSSSNIIHRDISPQNILVSREGVVKITDFGIAKVLVNADNDMTRSLKGKFRYMAPEMVDGKAIDHRYDLFAAAIVLYESLARRHLYPGKGDIEILNQIKTIEMPALSTQHPSPPVDLDNVLRRALDHDPDNRYQRAEDFSNALRKCLRPLTDHDAESMLQIFISRIYQQDDFPYNKPKLPDLSQYSPSTLSRQLTQHKDKSVKKGLLSRMLFWKKS